MRKWLVILLYRSLDDWAKWEVHQEIKAPSVDAVLIEQAKQSMKIFGGGK